MTIDVNNYNPIISWSSGNFGWLDLVAPLPLDLDLTTIFAAGKAAKCPIKGTHTPAISSPKGPENVGF